MNLTPRASSSSPHQRGFTLVELLIVIVIIGVLASLIFPAVRSMKTRAELTKCTSQLRQWSVAIQGYAGDHSQMVRYLDWEDIGGGKQHYNAYLGGGSQPLPPGKKVYPTQGVIRMCPSHQWNGVNNPPACYIFVRPNELNASGGYSRGEVDFDGDTVPDSYSFAKVARPSQLLVMMDSTVAGGTGGGGKRPYRTYEYTDFVKPVCINADKSLIRHAGSVNALFADGHIENLKWDQINPTLPANTQKVTTWLNLN